MRGTYFLIQLQPVLEKDLPVTLEQQQTSNCKCPKCGSDALREPDTMDTFFDSGWYWLRYLDPHNSKSIVTAEAKNRLPVNIYLGGIEHATTHLIYARFVAKFLSEEEIIELKDGEPFCQLVTQGMVKTNTYTCPDSLKYLKPSELDYSGTFLMNI